MLLTKARKAQRCESLSLFLFDTDAPASKHYLFHFAFVQIDWTHLGWKLDEIITLRQQQTPGVHDPKADYIVDNIIGVKVRPRKKLMYLTTFKGCVSVLAMQVLWGVPAYQ